MRRTLGIALLVAGLLLVPALTANAKQHGKAHGHGKASGVPAKTCTAERKAVGTEVFLAKYGSPAIPSCKGFVGELARNAAQECRQERRQIGRDPFNHRYGSNHNKRNAFGKCVSSRVKAAMADTCPEDLVEDDEGDDEDLGDDEGDIGDDEGELERAHASQVQYATCGDDEGDELDDDSGDDIGDDESDDGDE